MKKTNILTMFLILMALISALLCLSACNNKFDIVYTLTYSSSNNGKVIGYTEQVVGENRDGNRVVAVPDDGYEFDKWSDGVDTAEREDVNVTNNISVTAIFKKQREYTLTLDYGYDSIKTEFKVSKNCKVELPVLTRLGYEFEGWSYEQSGQCLNGNTLEISDDIYIWAQWKVNEYNIKYVLNGGTLENAITTFTINDLPLVLPMSEAQQDTYGFVKWTELPSGNELSILEKNGSSLRNIIVFAHYAECSKLFTFSYDEEFDEYYVSGYNSNVRNVTVPDNYRGKSIKRIGSKLFYGCDKLISVTIPDCVREIGEYAFANCCNLQSVKMTDSVKFVSAYAFYQCYNLANIELPLSIYAIGTRAFYNCKNIESVCINATIGIGVEAFYNCYKLSLVYIESFNVANNIEHNLFDNAKDIYILDTIEIVDGRDTGGLIFNPDFAHYERGGFSYELFEQSYEKQAEPVVVDGKSYIHYVYKF